MVEAAETDTPQSRRRRTWVPGLVWAVPLAALLIVGYLGVQAFANRGEVVTVTFRRAADARAGDTKVLYQGVEAGQLVKILPNKDGRRLDFRLRLVPQAKSGLNSNARFWLIGASPNLADLSSLKAVVSGVAIGYAPGEGGTPTDTFEGLDKAPIVLPADRGTRYVLEAHSLGSIQEGSIVLFHGQAIGKVTEVKFAGEKGFALGIFVFEPYDSLIKSDARFWKSNPLRLSLAGGGLNATLAPASTLLSGGIDLELPNADAAVARSPPETAFVLYATRSAAHAGLSGPTAHYEFVFEGAAGALDEDAQVTLLGFQIGELQSSRLTYDDKTGKPLTLVTAAVYPGRLNLTVNEGVSQDELQSMTDAKIHALLRLGYRARLQQSPALVGSQAIALVKVKGAGLADIDHSGAVPRIPSAPGSTDVDDIMSQTDQILAKVNHMPIERIGQDLAQISGRMRAFASSPKLDDGLAHMNSTLAEADQLFAQVQPQVGPLLAKLNQVAAQVADTARAAHELLNSEGGAQGETLPDSIRQLTDAARSVQTLADYLDRHPEALIRGKVADP